MKTYLCHNVYYATCEGYRAWISLERAKSKKDAVRLHVARFWMDEYFVRGVVAYDVVKELVRVEEILADYFSSSMVDSLLDRTLDPAVWPGYVSRPFSGFGDNFAFSFYVNRS